MDVEAVFKKPKIKPKYEYFAVVRGSKIGILTTYEDAKKSIHEYSPYKNLKGCYTRKDAENWLEQNVCLLSNLCMPQSADENLGIVGKLKKVASKIGIIDGKLFMKICVEDPSAVIEVQPFFL
jgi:viroplasmin and RNaseH domain-containing protein